jgi:hypothetical protein
MDGLDENFDERVRSLELWLPQSTDLNPYRYYVRGGCERQFYVKNQKYLEGTQENTSTSYEISSISVQQYRRKSGNIFSRCEVFSEAEGCRFETRL